MKWMNYWGFVVYGVYNKRFSCRKLVDWINNDYESVNYNFE